MGRERALSENLAKLSEAVAKWRAEHGGGGRGKRIPEELWSEAARVARSDGVWRTAKATRFNYQALKRRIANGDGNGTTALREITPAASGRRLRGRRAKQRTTRAGSSSHRTRRRKTEFVALSAAQLLGAPPTTGTIVEVEDQAGVRMIVRLAHEAHVDDVARLISAFRRCRG